MKIFNFISRHRSLDIIFLLLLNIFCHRGWFMPGIIEYGDWTYYPKDFLIDAFNLPFCWTTRFFVGPQFMLYGWPLQWLMGLVANLGFDFGVAERIVYFFPYTIISVVAIYYLTYILFEKRIICFFSTLFYIFNIPTLMVLGGALMDRMVAYALMPLAVALFIKGKREERFIYYLLSGLSLAILTFYELRIAYLVSGIIFLFFSLYICQLFINKNLNVAKTIKLFFYLSIIFFVPLILNFYWLYPSFVSQSTYMISGYGSSGWVKALSYFKWQHCLSVYLPSWPRGAQPGILYYIVPLLVFLAIVFRRKDNNVKLLTLLGALSVFLAKGANPPLGGLYIWLFKHIPGFDAFRDPGKFYMLICLAYSPLLGVSIEGLTSKLAEIKFPKGKKIFRIKYLQILFSAALFFIFIYLVWPSMTGKMEGAYYGRSIPEAYRTIEKFIKSQPGSFRTLWRPYHGDFSFYSEKYPAIRGHYSPLSTHFFLSDVWHPALYKDTTDMAKILGLLNIKYCFLPLEKEHLLGLEKDFLISTFNNQTGLKRVDIGGGVDAYENKNCAPQFFAASHSALIVGNRNALFRLASLQDINLARWALYFADEMKESSVDLLKNTDSVIFYESGLDELVLASLSDKYRINLFSYATKSDEALAGFWQMTDIFPAYSYGTAYGEFAFSPGGVIYAGSSGPGKLTQSVAVNITQAGTYEVWVRAARGPDKGRLSIWKSKDPEKYADEQILKDVDLRDNDPHFKWVKANDVYLDKGKTYFQIINKDGGGLADVLVIIPKKVIDKLRNEVKVALYSKSVITFTAGEYKTNNSKSIEEFFKSDENISVAWEQVNPTKYKVKLKIEKPTYLIFSDLYDPRWSLNLDNPLQSISAYSLINSFFIANPGEINATVEFTPQVYVYTGLLISGIGFILICLYLLWQVVKWTRRR